MFTLWCFQTFSTYFSLINGTTNETNEREKLIECTRMRSEQIEKKRNVIQDDGVKSIDRVR